nr:unnamed protein product [Digitaria exilis]
MPNHGRAHRQPQLFTWTLGVLLGAVVFVGVMAGIAKAIAGATARPPAGGAVRPAGVTVRDRSADAMARVGQGTVTSSAPGVATPPWTAVSASPSCASRPGPPEEMVDR